MSVQPAKLLDINFINDPAQNYLISILLMIPPNVTLIRFDWTANIGLQVTPQLKLKIYILISLCTTMHVYLIMF
jgi:hypothetical protein